MGILMAGLIGFEVSMLFEVAGLAMDGIMAGLEDLLGPMIEDLGAGLADDLGAAEGAGDDLGGGAGADIGSGAGADAAGGDAGGMAGGAADGAGGAADGAASDVGGGAGSDAGAGVGAEGDGAASNCFVKGTLVHTKTGVKPIEDIKVGDQVASRDPATGKTEWKPVVKLYRNHDKSVVTVTLTNGAGQDEQIGATNEHPFRVEGKGWVVAGKLQAGEHVVALTGEPLTVKSVTPAGKRATTYNFEVADDHTYFVGQYGAWVHNVCGEPTIGGGGTMDKLTPGEVTRIQNAANRSGQDIGVVGSRVNPNKALHPNSDYDYVINANHKIRSNLGNSLPGSKNIQDGIPSNQDIFKGNVDPGLPHVIFHPQ